MIATCFGDRPFTYLDKKNFFSSLSSTILRQVLDNICEAPIYCSLFFFLEPKLTRMPLTVSLRPCQAFLEEQHAK